MSKNLKILSSMTISGAVLAGSMGFNHADAAEQYSEVNDDNAVDIVKDVSSDHGMNPDIGEYSDPKDKGDYYEIHMHNKSHVGGSVYRVYKDGEVKSSGLANDEFTKFGSYDLAEDNNQTSESEQPKAENNNGQQDASTAKTDQNQKVNNQTTELPDSGQNDNTAVNIIIGSMALVLGIGVLASRKFAKK
ncbi:hypothetical protein CD039_09955 [Staphylococcus argensis]|uniref:Gram-positive cocci surface proteins LPxTG domain-containing protein n=1 Tax=Staphylococcus argensis TaxID=1607738 RepID=A0A2K4FAU2_9STAP|nr:LPXTG cell wall anchor domain-containing protein [Staphylococcus argensis]POA08396.1 hypothetical protein CD039_09955 [Staphylococcus argensis]